MEVTKRSCVPFVTFSVTKRSKLQKGLLPKGLQLQKGSFGVTEGTDESNTYRGNMDESDTEYENQNILVEERIADISTTIYYKDGCEKTINISISHDGIGSSPYTDCNSVELKFPNGTIDKKRSKKNKGWISKIGESDFEDEKCYRFAFEKHKYKHTPLRNNNLRNHYAFMLSLVT